MVAVAEQTSQKIGFNAVQGYTICQTMTVDEAADILGVPRHRVYDARSSQILELRPLRLIKLGRSTRVTRESVAKIIGVQGLPILEKQDLFSIPLAAELTGFSETHVRTNITPEQETYDNMSANMFTDVVSIPAIFTPEWKKIRPAVLLNFLGISRFKQWPIEFPRTPLVLSSTEEEPEETPETSPVPENQNFTNAVLLRMTVVLEHILETQNKMLAIWEAQPEQT